MPIFLVFQKFYFFLTDFCIFSGLKMPEIIGKLLKSDGKVVSDIEKQVSQALIDLETNDDVQSQLKELYIVGVKVRI